MLFVFNDEVRVWNVNQDIAGLKFYRSDLFLKANNNNVSLFIFHSQVDQIFDSIENEVRTDIQKNYGNENDMTQLWNTTMEQVLNLFLLSGIYLLW